MQGTAAQGALALRLVPGFALVRLHEGGLEGQSRIGEGGIHQLALAGAPPVEQGQGHAVCAHEAGAVVVYRGGLLHRDPAAAKADGHARYRLNERIVGRASGPGPDVPIGFERGVDDVRLALDARLRSPGRASSILPAL